MSEKMAVVGLDGFNDDLLEKIVEEAYIPNIEAIVDKGHSELKSVKPCQSAAAWTSFYTGQKPEDHGIYGFFEYGDYQNVTICDSNSIDSRTFMEDLSDQGKSVYLINSLLTWPPQSFNGVVIPGFLQDSGKYHPSNLDEAVSIDEWEYDVGHISKSLSAAESSFRLTKSREPVLDQFIEEEWDFLFLLFSGVDWIQHQSYDRIVSDQKEYDFTYLKQYFEQIDRLVGGLRSKEDVEIILMSDHGMKNFSKLFYINEWLKRRGYLVTRDRPQPKYWDSKFDFRLFNNKIARKLSRLTYSNLFLKPGLDRIIGRGPYGRGARRVLENNFSERIDFESSRAFVPSETEGGIHIKDSKALESIKEELEDLGVFSTVKVIPENVGKSKPSLIYQEEEYKVSTNILGVTESRANINYHDRKGLILGQAAEEVSEITQLSEYIKEHFKPS